MTDEIRESVFSGILGRDYELLKVLSPLAAEMSRLVGDALAQYSNSSSPQQVLELGGGTGITTLSLLTARDDAQIISIDCAATMQDQAKQHLKQWVEAGRLRFYLQDALAALRETQTESVDVVASAYTLHNFQDDYRQNVVAEIFRVLKPGGQFINGDRYALDNLSEHTRLIQEEVSHYFTVLTDLQRLDLLEQWIVHLFSDESEQHVMRESRALKLLDTVGFKQVKLSHRQQVNALVTALKPE